MRSPGGAPMVRGGGTGQGGRGRDLPKWCGIDEGHRAWMGGSVASPMGPPVAAVDGARSCSTEEGRGR
jgi:hypothetical protein